MPMGMVPQWPCVVTADMLQFPSTLAAPALASGTAQMLTNAADSTKAHVGLLIMETSPVLVNSNTFSGRHSLEYPDHLTYRTTGLTTPTRYGVATTQHFDCPGVVTFV